jgi:hypothetical protein
VEFTEYIDRFRKYAPAARIFTYGVVHEGGQDYPLLGAETPGAHLLVITSGFHGEEPAGPLTLLQHLEEVIDYARSRDVGLLVYPCINPSGFEDGSRYNRSGENPNNDFLRYEVGPGHWKGELEPGEPFLRWVIFDGGPKETKAIRAELERQQRRPNAALDIHQDNYMAGELTYAYVFGDQSAYSPIVEESEKHARVVKNAQVDEVNRTNDLGLIEYNDGSVTDYYLRRGVPYAAALETTTRTALESSQEINLNWIRGFVDLAARGE